MGHGIPSIPLQGFETHNRAESVPAPRATMQSAALGDLTDGRLEDFMRGAGAQSSSGAVVTAETALKTGTAFRSTALICGAIATLPLDIKRRLSARERLDADDHPASLLLRKQPNPWQTPSQFKRYMQACVLLAKGGFARIVRSRGRIIALIPLHPDRVEVIQNDDLSLTFRHTNKSGGVVDLAQRDVFYLCGLSLDGVRSVSVLSYARETVGEALATARHAATMFRNGTTVGGVLKAKGKLGADGVAALRESLESYRGADNAHKNLILQDDMTYERLGLSMQDAQFIQSREFSQIEIAMFFGVPPHMLGLTSKTTSWGSGIEQQSQGFVTYTLQDWLTMWVETIERDLLGGDDPRLYARFNTKALVRGDIKTRFGAYATARQWGWMSANDVLANEDEDAIEGGDVYLDPMNMKAAGAPPAPEPDTKEPAE